MKPSELPLKDIHLPAEVGAWPPAPGWWLLALCAIALVWLGARLWRRYRRRSTSLHSAALALFDQHAAAFQRDPQPQLLAQNINALLRRLALSCGHAEVARLTDQAWLAFVQAHQTAAQLHPATERLLVHQPYCDKPLLNAAELSECLQPLRAWVANFAGEANHAAV
jgi:hypothetical protein